MTRNSLITLRAEVIKSYVDKTFRTSKTQKTTPNPPPQKKKIIHKVKSKGTKTRKHIHTYRFWCYKRKKKAPSQKNKVPVSFLFTSPCFDPSCLNNLCESKRKNSSDIIPRKKKKKKKRGGEAASHYRKAAQLSKTSKQTVRSTCRSFHTRSLQHGQKKKIITSNNADFLRSFT